MDIGIASSVTAQANYQHNITEKLPGSMINGDVDG